MKHKLFTLALSVALILALTPAALAETEDIEPAVESTINVDAKSTKKGTIVVTWDKLSDAKSYEVYRSTKESGEYKRVKTLKGTKYTDKKVVPKKSYYYQIKVKKISGELSVNSYKSEIASAKLKVKKSFKVKAYAYTGGGTTKIGKKAKVGRIAVDPKVIKLGTWLYVEGYGVCQACDTGGMIKGKVIDVYKNTEKQCNKWGVKKPRVYILG